jgi:hypothetical protein
MAELSAGGRGWADLLGEGRLPKFALICLGVWLNAADALVTATIMPSVGADLGGYAYFSWSVAGFLVGAILAGASAGRLSELFGLRRATALSGLLTAAGCVMSAAAPDMFTFLAGRLVQGLGTGWISGFSMVAIALLFPERHLARVFAAVSGVWGVATLLGPLVGGIYAAGDDPIDQMGPIGSRIAFYADRVEVYEVEDAAVNPHRDEQARDRLRAREQAAVRRDDLGVDIDEVVQHTDSGGGSSQREHWAPNVMPEQREGGVR